VYASGKPSGLLTLREAVQQSPHLLPRRQGRDAFAEHLEVLRLVALNGRSERRGHLKPDVGREGDPDAQDDEEDQVLPHVGVDHHERLCLA